MRPYRYRRGRMEELLEASASPVASLDSRSRRRRPELTSVGKTLIGVFAAGFVGVGALALPFLLPAARRHCLPYVPATGEQVENVRRLLARGGEAAKLRPLVDLGSGDGRIVRVVSLSNTIHLVIECSKVGYTRCMGVELNPWLVLFSRYNAWKYKQPVHFRTQDLWKMDLTKYQNIVIFGVPSMMPKLEEKLKVELIEEGQVIACRFRLPTATPSDTIEAGIDTTWRYTRDSFDTITTPPANSFAAPQTPSHYIPPTEKLS